MILEIVALIWIVLAAGVVSQSASTTTSAASSSNTSVAAATHTIAVGSEGLNFVPNQVYADVGDIIEYRFYPLNHSVSRAAFGNTPCIPYEVTGTNRQGFWSGFKPITLVLNSPPIFRVAVNDTEPIFFYCSAPGSCQKGMIGVINPNATFTFDIQLNASLHTDLSFSPLEYFPIESAISRTTTAITTSSTSHTSTTHPSTTTTSPPTAAPATHSSTLGTGPIVGIAIGGFAVLVLAAALMYMCGRHRTVKEILRESTLQPTGGARGQGHNLYQNTMGMGASEAKYPNMMQKMPTDGSGGYGGFNGTETESYRSLSPPLDERSAMMGMQPLHFQGQNGGQSDGGLGIVSPQTIAGLRSPEFSGFGRHEMEDGEGVRSYTPNRGSTPMPRQEIHEMGVPSRNPSAATDTHAGSNVEDESRPFSYSDSEKGFQAARR